MNNIINIIPQSHKISSIIFCGFFCLFLISCGKGKLASFEVKKIVLQCDSNLEDGSIVFKVNVRNNSPNDILITDSGNEGMLQSSSFLLISNQLYDGAISLKLGLGNGILNHEGISIKKGELKDIWISVYRATLRQQFKNNNKKEASVSDIKDFLNSSNYSINYISFKDSVNYFIFKPEKLKCSCNL